jgi:dihydrodipicolinate reductase
MEVKDMDKINVFVIGSGKLANALLTSGIVSGQGIMLPWDSSCQRLNEKAILVHAGSGRQLKDCIDFCNRTKSVLIELSTGLETETLEADFPLVICPNTSVLVLKTMAMLKAYGSSFENYTITITESHQSAKTTEAGTAVAFAHALKFPPEKIQSVRDTGIQQYHIGIPVEYVAKHAYHKIVIKDVTDEVTIETRVLGHQSYAKGVKAIVEAVINHQLENKRYHVLDLVERNML